MNSHGFIKSIRKSIKVILLFSLIMMMIINTNGQKVFEKSQTQLIYRVSNVEEAPVLANYYNLNILSISPSKIVVFETTTNTDIALLLSLGFAYNEISFAEKIIWPIKKDPYIYKQYALEMMQTIDAWDITTGNADVMVAIIDTGIEATHPEFQGRISNLSYNAVTEEIGIDAVADDEGHGTMVAGVIGANKDNGAGIAGIAQNIELLVIKANIANEGKFLDSALIDGIYYAVDNGADIINLSLGGPYANPQTKLAVEYAKEQGVVVVAAAGNEGTDNLNYPAAFDSTLSVSAVDQSKVLANYSNYGPTISIAAPGTEILSTSLGGTYSSGSGTSLAAPQISGVLALIKSLFPNLSHHQLINRLLLSADDVGPKGKDDSFGYGIANTYNALTYEFVTINFETFSGSTIEPITITKNSKLPLPEDPILTDYTFERWYKNPEFTDPWLSDVDLVTNDLTLYAKYHKTNHLINFITPGDPLSPMVVKHGETFTLPQASLKDHIFIGWTLDEENKIVYEPGIVLDDLTLYAHFRPIPDYQVTLWVDNDIYDIIFVKEGQPLPNTTPLKPDYTFEGWYKDPEFTDPWLSDVDLVTNDLTLYAKYHKTNHLINFITPGDPLSTMVVKHGETFTLPQASLKDHIFIGWTLDEENKIVYEPGIVLDDLTLYAHFRPIPDYQVTLWVDNDIYDIIFVKEGQPFTAADLNKIGYTFSGWYLDSDYTAKYSTLSITSDINLYSKFDIKTFTVTYYYEDKVSILFSTTVDYGNSIDAPQGPKKEPTQIYDYSFQKWSESSNNVTSNLNIYPLYKETLKPGIVMLQPGIDTIKENEKWIDGGVLLSNERLSYIVDSNVNTEQSGRYLVNYSIYDGDSFIIRLTRVVNVIPNEQAIVITLKKGITTIPVGEKYVDAGAIANIGTINASSNVDTSKPGVYQVKYQVEINNQIYQKIRFVHVFDPISLSTTIKFKYKKKENYNVA